MAKVYRKIVGGGKYLPWKHWEPEDWVEGRFLGTSTDQFDKTNYQIEVEDHELDYSLENFVKSPECKNKSLEIKKGDTLILNSMGSLDYKMQSVEVGQTVKVTYKGVTKLPENHKYKNKDSHQVDVEVAESDAARSL